MVAPQEHHHCHQDSRGTTSTRYRGAAGGENHPSYCCGRCCRSTCPSYQLRTRRLRMYACRKCIPFTQKAHVLGMYVEGVRDCLRVLHMCTQHTQQQVGCSSSSLRQHTCHPFSFCLPTAAVTSSGCQKYHSHGTPFVVPFLALIGPGACCKRCTAPRP